MALKSSLATDNSSNTTSHSLSTVHRLMDRQVLITQYYQVLTTLHNRHCHLRNCLERMTSSKTRLTHTQKSKKREVVQILMESNKQIYTAVEHT